MKTPKKIVMIDGTHPAKCELCGKIEELRPYGPNGEAVCFDCAMKDEPAARRAFDKLTKDASMIIIK
jgi:hypothetical protein